uniref:hypothetical protein n=1 Tax=Methylomonas sp. SPW-1 TaxID=3438877 RepID=UPI00402B1F75
MTRLIDTIVEDPAASNWLKTALRTAIERDPVDAVNDAEILLSALKEKLNELHELNV